MTTCDQCHVRTDCNAARSIPFGLRGCSREITMYSPTKFCSMLPGQHGMSAQAAAAHGTSDTKSRALHMPLHTRLCQGAASAMQSPKRAACESTPPGSFKGTRRHSTEVHPSKLSESAKPSHRKPINAGSVLDALRSNTDSFNNSSSSFSQAGSDAMFSANASITLQSRTASTHLNAQAGQVDAMAQRRTASTQVNAKDFDLAGEIAVLREATTRGNEKAAWASKQGAGGRHAGMWNKVRAHGEKVGKLGVKISMLTREDDDEGGGRDQVWHDRCGELCAALLPCLDGTELLCRPHAIDKLHFYYLAISMLLALLLPLWLLGSDFVVCDPLDSGCTLSHTLPKAMSHVALTCVVGTLIPMALGNGLLAIELFPIIPRTTLPSAGLWLTLSAPMAFAACVLLFVPLGILVTLSGLLLSGFSITAPISTASQAASVFVFVNLAVAVGSSFTSTWLTMLRLSGTHSIDAFLS